MRNLLMKISYDGKRYHGWQVQQNAIAVQQVFQDSLERILQMRPDIKGCSRTDAGVHAYSYCISMKLEHPIPCERLLTALNHFLPKDMAVLSIREVPMDFHARYSCTGKEYLYRIWNRPVRDPFMDGYMYHYWYPMDMDRMNRAAQHFLGTHDFTSFCTLDKRETGDFTRTVTRAEVFREGDLVTFAVAADGFLYNMVRIMTGTLLRVAQKKFEPEDIPEIILAKDRGKAGPTVPACGLYLNRVFYGGEEV